MLVHLLYLFIYVIDHSALDGRRGSLSPARSPPPPSQETTMTAAPGPRVVCFVDLMCRFVGNIVLVCLVYRL